MSEKAPAVLIVDDEDMVLSSLRGVFTLQTDFEILEANNPKDAIGTLERTPVDVVISDFLMPEMNGIEFLKEVKRIQPESVRLLLTGYADKENAIKAINDVGIYHYLEKPWDNEALLNIVRNALQEKSLKSQLAEKVHELDQLSDQHSQLESRHRSLERELEMAARVQRSLLPKEFPEVLGFCFANLYEPCEAIGGDFYDVLDRGDAGVVLLVSDVIGHGVQAALTTMLLKGVFREAAVDIDEPITLLEEMNRRLYAVMPTGMYAAASVFYLGESGEIPFSNAGLPYPFVLRKERRLDEIVLSGPPLGLLETGVLPYEERVISTSPGDVLLAGSDGLGSIVADDGSMFEDREMRRLLTELAGEDGRTIVERAMEAGRAFGNGRPIPDDINLVAVTRTSPGSR